MLTPEQVRAARALLKIDQGTLADRAGVSVETIKRFERSEGPNKAQESTIASIGGALEKSGIVLIGENEKSYSGGVGVRFAERVDADEWNKRLDETLSSITASLSKADYEEIASAYSKMFSEDRSIEADDIESLLSEILNLAERRLHKHSYDDAAMFDFMTQRDPE